MKTTINNLGEIFKCIDNLKAQARAALDRGDQSEFNRIMETVIQLDVSALYLTRKLLREIALDERKAA